MSDDLPAFLENKRFENKSADEILPVIHAVLAFLLHFSVSTTEASLLFKFNFVKMNSVSKPQIRPEPFQHIFLTNEGEQLANEIAKYFANEFGVSKAELKNEYPDFMEDTITDFEIMGWIPSEKYLMHRYRLEKELASSWDRRNAILQIYAIWF